MLVTVAVKVTDWPYTDGFTSDVTVVFVGLGGPPLGEDVVEPSVKRDRVPVSRPRETLS